MEENVNGGQEHQEERSDYAQNDAPKSGYSSEGRKLRPRRKVSPVASSSEEKEHRPYNRSYREEGRESGNHGGSYGERRGYHDREDRGGYGSRRNYGDRPSYGNNREGGERRSYGKAVRTTGPRKETERNTLSISRQAVGQLSDRAAEVTETDRQTRERPASGRRTKLRRPTELRQWPGRRRKKAVQPETLRRPEFQL